MEKPSIEIHGASMPAVRKNTQLNYDSGTFYAIILITNELLADAYQYFKGKLNRGTSFPSRREVTSVGKIRRE